MRLMVIGIASASKKLRIPVIGPGQASLIFAGMLAERFGILAPGDALVERIYEMVKRYGLQERVTSIGSVNIPLLQLRDRREELRQRAIEFGKKAIGEGAELILPFGMAVIPAYLSCEELALKLGVPVLNPAEVGLRLTEMAAAVRMRAKN
jgi:allantoin racemase